MGSRVHFLGTGDAFGSGGRFHTCFFVDGGATRFLIDCGASSLIAMKRFGVRPDSVDAIVCSHLHGDHIGGIPFLVRETQVVPGRDRPLTVVGPRGMKARLALLMEALFPGSSVEGSQTFALEIVEFEPGRSTWVGPLEVRAYPGRHTPGTNPHSLRLRWGGVTIAYSGDTEWTDHLLEAAHGADLFIAEAYQPEPVRGHLDYATLLEQRARLACRRIVLTHLGEEMQRLAAGLAIHCVRDGEVIDL